MMVKWLKKRIVFVVAIITLLAVIFAPFLINASYKTNGGYLTVWDGSAVLAYFGTIVSAVGTIILGIIAWQQNTRLLAVEENTFIASNACSALLTDVTITKINSTSIAPEKHDEQIVYTKDTEKASIFTDLASVQIICELIPMCAEKHAALVNVSKLFIQGSNQQNRKKELVAFNEDKRYSRVAISKDFDRFYFTLVMSKEESDLFAESIDDMYSQIYMEVDISLMTDKYVTTQLKCRAYLCNPDYDEKQQIYSHFKLDNEQPPMCFWYGAEVKHKQEVSIKTVAEDRTQY